MTLKVNYGYFSGVGFGIAGNGLHLTEVGDYEAQTFKFKQMYNRSTTVNFSTTPPILIRCCYMPFFFTNLD